MINIQNLNISFQTEIIFTDFSLSVQKGEKLAITGESGKGKSTLLNLLTGFIPEFKGEVSIDGISLNSKNINEIRTKMAWLPQEFALNLQTVEELLFAPFEFELNRANRPSRAKALEIFNALGLTENLLSKKLKEISGGQKQRVLLTSSILLNKPIMLLDEPTSALDHTIKKSVTDYILSKPDLTVVAVTHDEYWAAHSDRTLHLK